MWPADPAVCVMAGLALPLLSLLATAHGSASGEADACGGVGNPAKDWLVTPCATAATVISYSGQPTSWVLRNGIVKRTLTLDPTTMALSTTALISEVTGVDKLAAGRQPVAPLAEAELSINGVNVLVGGPNASTLEAQNRPAAVQLTFASFRQAAGTVAGNFSWVVGSRGTRKDRSWPPDGVHAEFDHTGPCHAMNAGPSGIVNVTVVYELYQGVSAFSKRLLLSHSCTENIFVFNMSVHLARHRNTKTGQVELIADGQPGLFLKGTALSSSANVNAAAYEPVAQSLALDRRFGPGLSQFPAGKRFLSFMVLELIHDADGPPQGNMGGLQQQGGAHRFLLETAAAQRTVSPQIEQFPIQMEAVCTGGVDGSSHTAGAASRMWCYDEKGTAGIFALLDQAAEVGIEMISFGVNMNGTWRSSIGNEFQSAANISWFKNITDYAKSKGIETGAYQLLRNARSATFANGCAPGDAANHSLHPQAGFDAMDLPPPLGTGLTCHKNNKTTCRGGPGCCALCAGTEFFDEMRSSMLDFWDKTGMTVVDQDGAETGGPPCANESHKHHHGLNDSLWVNYVRTEELYKEYCKRGGFIQGMPGLHLEGGQSKRPGGYDEMMFSLPRWTWIHRSRVNMIGPGRSQTESNAVRAYPVPLVPYHPSAAVDDPENPGRRKFDTVVGYESSATLEPLDEHLVELEWALSQTYGTGITGIVRGYRAYQSEKSRAVWLKWNRWFKRYRLTLTTEFQTLQCATECWDSHAKPPPVLPNVDCNVSSWDGVIHWSPKAQFPTEKTRAVAVIWNPLTTTIQHARIVLPLYYAGFTASGSSKVMIREGERASQTMAVGANDTVTAVADLAPLGVTYFVVEGA
jgi:ribosome modulation factor